MLTPEQREQRKTSLGSSEISLIALGPSFADQSLYELWCEKTGQDVPPRESDEMNLGAFLEPGIAAMFAHREKISVLKGCHRRHKQHDWMSCTTDYDALGRDPSRLIGPVECKAYRWSEEWGADREPEAVPPAILIQVNWQMACMNADHGWVAALVGGDFRTYPCPRSQLLIDRLIEMGREFWEAHVLANVPPEPDYSIRRTGRILDAMYPPKGKEIFLPNEALEIANAYQFAVDAIKAAEDGKESARNRLLGLLKDASCGVLPDGRRVTRSVDRRGVISLRVSKTKGNDNGQI